jgi:hypothetical protein
METNIIHKDAMNLDAGESAFFKRQLEYIKRRTYDQKLKNLKAKTLIPVSNEAPSAIGAITFRRFDAVGLAKIIADYAKDFPRVDIFGTEQTVKNHGIGASYGYNIQEIRRAQIANLRLNQRRAEAARRAIEEKSDNIAWNGDADYNIQGLIDYPGITEYTVPDPGEGTEWVNKTPLEILYDLNAIVTAIVDSTNGVEAPDTMIMPIEQFNLINDTPIGDNVDKTILQFFLSNSRFIKTVEWVVELAGAGAGGADRFMVYPRDDMHLTLEIPQPFEQFAPQQKGMEFEVMVHEETAGVIVYYPQSIAFGDGI